METLFRLAQVVEKTPNMVIITDPEGNIEYVNPAFVEMSGYRLDEAIGANPRILRSDKTPRQRFFDLWQTIKRGDVWRGELCNRHKNGMLIWNFVSISPLFNEQGVISHFISVQVDITERKRTEVALRESEARLSAIANAIPDLVFVLDEDGRYIEVLTSQGDLLDFHARILKGKLLSEVHGSEKAAFLLAIIKKALATRQIQVAEYELKVMSGQRWFESRTAPIDLPSTHKPAVIVVARDITVRKVAEERLRQSQKLEAIGHLTGGVAHDFNNLLAIILGNLELMDEQLGDRPELQDLMRRAFGAAQRGALLTQRLLAFSRQQPLQARPTDLNRLVSGMIDILRRTLGETIQLQAMLANDLWSVCMDPGQLENALLNLCLNARDAMPRGGRLRINTANYELDNDQSNTAGDEELQPGEYVMIAVNDTGVGMTPEVVEHAFEPFFTTKEVGKGSGLGLSMVYGFVKQSGGHVTIDSKPGQGTTIRMYLPRSHLEALPVTTTRSSKPPPSGQAETILVVEDDATVRQLTVSMIHSLGYLTLEAGTAETALDKLAAHRQVALLFTDVVLPGGMNGFDLAALVQQRYPHLKVLFTSGYTEHGLFDGGDLREHVELLAKPYRKADLADKLQSILKKTK
jgi:PAS domain S-box-containing protein